MRSGRSAILHGFLWSQAAALVLSAACASAQNVQVTVTRDGDWVAVLASAEVPVDAQIVWEVLTDYDHYSEFIPDMSGSRIASRGDDGLVVEFKGEFRFLFFSQPMESRLAVVLHPRSRVEARSLSGSFRDLSSIYELREVPGAVQLVYSGRFIPEFSPPPLIGAMVVRLSMEKQFAALVAEMVRRGERMRSRSVDDMRPAR